MPECQKKEDCNAVKILTENGYVEVVSETAKKKKAKAARNELKMVILKRLANL